MQGERAKLHKILQSCLWLQPICDTVISSHNNPLNGWSCCFPLNPSYSATSISHRKLPRGNKQEKRCCQRGPMCLLACLFVFPWNTPYSNVLQSLEELFIWKCWLPNRVQAPVSSSPIPQICSTSF